MIRKIFFYLLLYTLILIISICPIALIRLNILGDIIPNLELYIIYFSALYYPVSIFQIFVYGFLVDQIYGSLVGLHSSLFILVYMFLSRMRSILLSKLPFSLFWGFLVLVLLFSFTKYMILGQMLGYYASLLKIVLQICTNILLYPVFYFCLSKTSKIYESYVR